MEEEQQRKKSQERVLSCTTSQRGKSVLSDGMKSDRSMIRDGTYSSRGLSKVFKQVSVENTSRMNKSQSSTRLNADYPMGPQAKM